MDSIPYILVIAALFGVNVFSTLIIGTVLAGAIGYIGGSLVLQVCPYEGFTGMTDIFFYVDAYRRFSCDGGKSRRYQLFIVPN
jgi:Na+/H+ antiporter NhaC